MKKYSNIVNPFLDHFSFVSERQQTFATNRLQFEDDLYATLSKEQADKYERVEKILSKLSDEDSEYITDYYESETDTNCIECDSIYIQGYRDCVEFFKLIGVI